MTASKFGGGFVALSKSVGKALPFARTRSGNPSPFGSPMLTLADVSDVCSSKRTRVKPGSLFGVCRFKLVNDKTRVKTISLTVMASGDYADYADSIKQSADTWKEQVTNTNNNGIKASMLVQTGGGKPTFQTCSSQRCKVP